MNLAFRKTGIGRAENGDGAVVESMDRELMRYERPGFHLPVETFFVDGIAVVYQPRLMPSPLPPGMSAADIYAEIRAGIAVAAECAVRWKVGDAGMTEFPPPSVADNPLTPGELTHGARDGEESRDKQPGNVAGTILRLLGGLAILAIGGIVTWMRS